MTPDNPTTGPSTVPSGSASGTHADMAPSSASRPTEPDTRALYDFVDAVADRIEKGDSVVGRIALLVEQDIKKESLEIPRMPHVAAKILEFAHSTDASTKDVIRQVRTDPVLSGKLIEMANSATYAGSQPVFSLKGAIIRLGLHRVGEAAMEMSGTVKSFQKEKRSNMLTRLWKYSLATGFACEALTKDVPSECEDSAFLTGIFHAVAAPVIVDSVGRLERSGSVPAQSDSRVLGLLDQLTVPLTGRIVRRWNLPKEAREAIRLQNLKVRDRRGKPLAHILVCGKRIVQELGIGTRPEPIDFDRDRDFKFIDRFEDQRLEPIRACVRDKMIEITGH